MELYRYKKRDEAGNLQEIEAELTADQIAEHLSKRKTLTIFNDRIEAVLNDPDITDLEIDKRAVKGENLRRLLYLPCNR